MGTRATFAPGIPIFSNNIVYALGGRSFTGAQLHQAIEVCIGISQAYALADIENGGGERILWEGLDEVAEKADEALGEHLAEVNEWAKRENGFTPSGWNAGNAAPGDFSEDIAALAQGERKKADDTEGGACD